MQRKLLGIAVAAALAPAAAFAQPAGTGVQIYGLLDFSVHFNKFDDAAVGSAGDVSKAELHSSASRLGVRGREALGAGLNGWFQLEAGIAPFRPDPNGPANGAGFFGGRDTAVGLEGGWGTIMAGTWGTPYKVANLATWNLGTYGIVSHYGMIMNNGDSTGTEPSPNCANEGRDAAGAATQICGNGIMVEGGLTQFGRRASNSVQYWTPTIGGFQARIGTQLSGLKSTDGATANTDPQLWSFSAAWTGGPFTVGGAYEIHDEFRATGAVGAPRPKDTAWMIGAKWTGGPFSIGAAYEFTEYESSTVTGNGFEKANYVINGAFRLANGEIFAGYSFTKGAEECGVDIAATCAGDANEASLITAGYAHNLSKRTKAYLQFGLIKNEAASAVYYIAGPAGNAASGTGGLLLGTDVQTFGIGVQHSF